MQNFILVSVAIGIFSGTTLTAKAQPSVNLERINNYGVQQKPGKFIEGIEIHAGPVVNTVSPFDEKSINTKTVNSIEMITVINEVAVIENFSSIQFKYAQLLDIDVELVTNKALFNEIEKWMGTRYRYGGATEKGIDCSAYTGTLVNRVFGLVLPRTSRDQYEQCIKIEKTALQQGDLVFFKTGRGISHVGLYLGNGYFTHASTSIGVTVSHLSEEYWNRKYSGSGRINTGAAEE